MKNPTKNSAKYHQILDALQELLENSDIQYISVSDIAQKAGIGKGSIYYYFPSKDAIVDALIVRSYEKPIETAKNLSNRTDISPFTRMSMIFQACRSSSSEFLKHGRKTVSDDAAAENVYEKAYIHQKYLKHVISELKPVLAEIIQQGIDNGEIQFDYPAQLAEIALIVLTVKLDNTLTPAPAQDIEQTLRALVTLLEKGTDNPSGSLDFLTEFSDRI